MLPSNWLWNLRCWNLQWARPNCNFRHILIKLGLTNIMNFYISERKEACPKLSCFFSLSGVCDRVKQCPPTYRHLSHGKTKRKKRKKDIKGNPRGKMPWKGKKGLSCSVKIFCTDAGMAERTRSQSQPLRGSCTRHRSLLTLPAAGIVGKKEKKTQYK